MKLTRLSLVAIATLFCNGLGVANATPLEEAIKNVDVSGYARYRYTNNNIDDKGNKSTSADHRLKFVIDFKAAIDDNFFGVVGLLYDTRDDSGSKNAATDKSYTENSFSLKKIYLGYSIGNTTITAGRQNIGTYFESILSGVGIKIINKDIKNITLIAAAFDALDKFDSGVNGGSNRATTQYDGALLPYLQNKHGISGNFYTIGVMGNFNPVIFKAWYANFKDVGELYAADMTLNFDINNIKLDLQGQYVHNEADYYEFNNADFYAFKAGVDAFGLKVNAGYLNFEVDDSENGKVGKSFLTIEGNGKLINSTKILNSAMSAGSGATNKGESHYYNTIKGENEFWFINAKYTFNKFSIGAGYTDGEGYSYQLARKADRSEWYGQFDYKYSKKLNLIAWYASAKDEKDYKEVKHDRFRFEAKYTF
ncbi:major outer membrane protein [Campylobacter sp. faydin G-105]|uniref:major outer membrane protein n=1 Tax=Campylobacter anatolicus TaxID=2829105 RepID=UPI001B96CDF8|nr:major outer membrane protein [Campylobacter anatolicus]MBR8462037.1 major outer membrane protein [Campylobacter anatolicus]